MHGREIRKTFVFPDLQTALDFVNRVGAVAEEQGIVPTSICPGDVTASTPDAGG
jgi:pterin-4a-carbinolamine dehydratase